MLSVKVVQALARLNVLAGQIRKVMDFLNDQNFSKELISCLSLTLM